MTLTLWGRNNCQRSLDALAWLKDRGVQVDRLLDVMRQPPTPREWAQISLGLEGLVDAVDKEHPRFREVFHHLDRLEEKKIAMLLDEHRDMIRTPILLKHDETAVAGFDPRAWKNALNVR